MFDRHPCLKQLAQNIAGKICICGTGVTEEILVVVALEIVGMVIYQVDEFTFCIRNYFVPTKCKEGTGDEDITLFWLLWYHYQIHNYMY